MKNMGCDAKEAGHSAGDAKVKIEVKKEVKTEASALTDEPATMPSEVKNEADIKDEI